MKLKLIITLFLVTTLFGCGSEESDSNAEPQGDSPHETGKQEANTAISQGKLCWKRYGQPSAVDPLFKQILKEEYNVDLLVVAGCNVPYELSQNANGYNEIMKAEILKRFEKDIIHIAWEKAGHRFEDQRKK